jgi:hypothetical protein
VVESVIRYVLRLTSRATPFGLFAGVAPLRIGSTASVRWDERHHATWLIHQNEDRKLPDL